MLILVSALLRLPSCIVFNLALNVTKRFVRNSHLLCWFFSVSPIQGLNDSCAHLLSLTVSFHSQETLRPLYTVSLHLCPYTWPTDPTVVHIPNSLTQPSLPAPSLCTKFFSISKTNVSFFHCFCCVYVLWWQCVAVHPDIGWHYVLTGFGHLDFFFPFPWVL